MLRIANASIALLDMGSLSCWHKVVWPMTEQKVQVTTSHWGAFKVITEGDRIVGTAPFEADPNPSDIPRAVPGAVHHKLRVARPAIRKGWLEGGADRARHLRGKDEFVELPWDEALDITAQELERVRKAHTNEAIYGGSYGWASAGRFHHSQSQVHRFLNCIGGYVSSFASYSTAAAQAIVPHVLGEKFHHFTYDEANTWAMIAEHTETLVMFGGINPKNAQVSMGGVTRHEVSPWLSSFAKAGKHMVTIAPQRDDGPEGSRWLAIVPGSDTAMMLGLAYVLETEGLADRGFLASHAEGYEKFVPYLLGEGDGVPKTPEWAAELCGVPSGGIIALARQMANSRTLITIAWSLQRAHHGEQPYWMATVLAAMLGQFGLPGAGIGYGYGAIGGIGADVAAMGGLTLPQGQNPIETFIPVARVADMLLHPGEDYDFNGARQPYPDIKLVYWCGGNPFHHHQDLNRLAEAFRQPDTVIVHEPWWTATAQHADIVLPATTPYEREDIGRTFSCPFLFHMPALIPPVGEARDDFDIFRGLAKRMGQEDAFAEGRDAAEWLEHLYAQFQSQNPDVAVPALSDLKAQNWVELPISDVGKEAPLKAFRDDPVANPLGTPSGKIEIYSQTIAGFGYDDCLGHPAWLPPMEWIGNAEDYPLHMVSPQPSDKLHSQLEAALADDPEARPTRLEIHPDDAAVRGVEEGSLVRVFNARGSTLARAHLSEAILPRVVALPTGAWFSPGSNGVDQQGNPNVLTRDVGTSRLGQGNTAHSALVEVELA